MKDGPAVFNEAEYGDIAGIVLMTSDPLNVKYIAETYLEEPVWFNSSRNMLGYTGTYKKKQISVMASGIGVSSMGIYSYELFHYYGVKTVIQIGTACRLQEDVSPGHIIVGMGVSSDTDYDKQLGLPGVYSLICDYDLLWHTTDLLKEKGIPYRVGNILTSSVYYGVNPNDLIRWKEMGILAVEMEAAALYLNAARAGKRALCLLISEKRPDGGKRRTQEPDGMWNRLAETALDVCITTYDQ